MFKRLKRYLHSPYYEIGRDIMQRWPRIMSDKWYVKVQYLNEVGCRLNLKEPKTFTEKMQWLKIHDHNPLYTTLVDKYLVKSWVSKRIGSEHVIPTLAVWNNANEIDINQLPDRFVLKCNHDCGSVIICKNKKTFNIDEAKHKLSIALKKNHYYYGREWPYKNVHPIIIAEPYLFNSNDQDYLTDYKFFCFNGKHVLTKIVDRRGAIAIEDIYDADFNPLPIHLMHFPTSGIITSRPAFFNEMKSIADALSKGIPLCRVDMYYASCDSSSPRVLLGEMSLYDSSGYDPFVPEEWNKKIGSMLELPTQLRY